jgi:hypothetical protein
VSSASGNVARGDRVALRRGAARRDAQQLAAQVVRVRGGRAGVVQPRVGRALREWGVATGRLRVRVDVVADAEQQVAVQVHVEAAARVARLVGPASGGHLEDQLLRRRIDDAAGADGEAGEPVEPVGLVVVVGRLRRVVQVDELVLLVVVVDRDPEQAVLAVGVDGERERRLDAAVGRVVDADLAAHQLGEEDEAVGRDVERERRARVVVERDLLERVVDRAAAVALVQAGRVLDAADDVLEELRLVVVGAEVAQRGDERAAAVIGLAPRDRVVVAHRVAARRVRRLVHREQHVGVAADVGVEVVPLVGAQPAGVAEVPGRRVRAVLDDHLGGRRQS